MWLLRGHAWLLWGAWACMVAQGMCMVAPGGACMFAPGGACVGYDEIRRYDQ